jgi:hypothetical protein
LASSSFSFLTRVPHFVFVTNLFLFFSFLSYLTFIRQPYIPIPHNPSPFSLIDRPPPTLFLSFTLYGQVKSGQGGIGLGPWDFHGYYHLLLSCQDGGEWDRGFGYASRIIQYISFWLAGVNFTSQAVLPSGLEFEPVLVFLCRQFTAGLQQAMILAGRLDVRVCFGRWQVWGVSGCGLHTTS